MHPNTIFRQEPKDRNLAFARHRGFGTLMLGADPMPLVAHVPFWLGPDGMRVEMHLMRSNPIARTLTAPRPAMLAVLGPDGYVSPDWYGDATQVPTWNYVAVHLHGTLAPMPPDTLRAHLDRLSAAFEARLAPKPAWTTDKMPPKKLEGMMRGILPFALSVESIDGTWKLNQNKPDDMRLRAAAEISGADIGQETAALAALMQAIGDTSRKS